MRVSKWAPYGFVEIHDVEYGEMRSSGRHETLEFLNHVDLVPLDYVSVVVLAFTHAHHCQQKPLLELLQHPTNWGFEWAVVLYINRLSGVLTFSLLSSHFDTMRVDPVTMGRLRWTAELNAFCTQSFNLFRWMSSMLWIDRKTVWAIISQTAKQPRKYSLD